MSNIALIAPAAIAVTGAALALVQAYRLHGRTRRAAHPEISSQGTFRFYTTFHPEGDAKFWTPAREPHILHPKTRA